MSKVELVYFAGCPSIPRARAAIHEAGVQDFAAIEQGALPSDHPYKRLSSPSILVDGKLVSGSEGGASACSLTNWDRVAAALREALASA